MSYNNNILFVGHDASRTGAPLLMLELIKWLCIHSNIKPSVLLKRGGPLEPNFRVLEHFRCLEPGFSGKKQGFIRKASRKLISGICQWNLARRYPPKNYPLIYANTIDTCDLALKLAGPGRRLVLHIHELSCSTEGFGATETLKKTIPFTNAYIAASHAVGQFLEKNIGAPAAKIHVIHEFPIAVNRDSSQNKSRQTLRHRLGIPGDAFIIGMCGYPQWRKGTDLFIQLAMLVKARVETAKCHFVWLGGDLNSQRDALYDVAQAGLQDTCHFIPAVSNPEDYLSGFDLYALTSREDPFSVAMLESAACGLPIVCFAGAGGAPELVEHDAGIIVPYLDIPAMAEACIELLLDDNRRHQMGNKARDKVQTRYSLAVQGPKLKAVLEAWQSP